MPAGPNVPRLMTLAKKLAKSLRIAPAPDKVVRNIIDDVLYGRRILAAGREGLITREETGYVLVGHWHTDLFAHATFKGDDHDFVREVAEAILGPRAKKPPARKKAAAKKAKAKKTRRSK